jgi:uncharacterized membrane protein
MIPSNPRPEPGFSASVTSNPDAVITYWAHKLVLGMARHWLAIFNLAWGAYVLLPFCAPILLDWGLTTPARIIYAVYSVMCHQLPDHSYFLFGASATPNLSQLEAGGMAAGLNPFAQRQFVGNQPLGYKVAICQRDVAIYGSVLLAGLLFALGRQRWPNLTLRWYLLFLIPMAIDGGTQLFGLRESNWWLRTLTGMLFGMGSVWLAYPFVNDAMQDVMVSEERVMQKG